MLQKNKWLGLLSGFALLALAACGKVDDSKLQTVSVGVLPVPDLIVLHEGAAKGFFTEEGIDVKFVDIPRGDASVTALLSNAVQFANIDVVTGLVAREKGLPIKWVATAHSSPDSKATDFAGTFVTANSPIKSWADLNGKKVAVSCRKCGSELYIRGAVDQNGGDSSTLQLVVMPTAQAVPALGEGHIDAVPVQPGLVPKARAAGYRKIGDHIAETALGHPLGPIAVDTDWADAHPALVAKFVRAVQKSTAYAEAHPDEERSAMPKFYPQIVPDQKAAADVALSEWHDCFRDSAMETLVRLSLKYGFITKPITDINSLYYSNNGISVKKCS